MKKFFFSLNTVLDYKDQILENLKGEHARALLKVRVCEDEIAKLEEEHLLCSKRLEESRFQGMTIRKIKTHENYLEQLGVRIKNKYEELARLMEDEQRKRDEVIEAKKETSMISKLKEKKQMEYNQKAQKEEEQFIEEFVSTKKAMAKING